MMVRLAVFALVMTLNSAWASVVVLIDENFSDGVVGPTPAAGSWVNSSSGSPEVAAGTGFATARALATTYDHDNNPGTGNINIPGGLEVNVSAVSTQTITVIMPGSFDLSPNNIGTLTFWAAVRANNATGATVSIINITDGVTILAATTPAFATTNTNWQFNTFSFTLLPSYAGDQVNVVFNGGGSNGANGLELTDIDFAVNVPEPTMTLLLSCAGLAGFARRRRSDR